MRPSPRVSSPPASGRAPPPEGEGSTAEPARGGGASGAVRPAAERARDPFERRLVRRLKAGDDRAFEELVRTYQTRIYGLVYRMLGDRHEAEDVAQDVFLAVHRSIGRYRGEGRFQTWLFRIAANACRTRLRRRATRADHRTEPLDGVLEGHAPAVAAPPVAGEVHGPEAAMAGRRLEAAIQRELSALDEDQRLLIVLRDVQGLSYQEILEITGLAEGTLKSRLHRARLALKERLRPYLS